MPARLPLALTLALLATGCSDYNFSPEKEQNLPSDPEDTAVDTSDPVDTGEVDPDSASLKGRVCDLTGEGYVVGATAYIELDDGSRIGDTTDADGYFTLTGIPLGTHTVHVEKGSFSTSFDVTLEEPGLTELVEEECLQPESVKIAVVTGQYDHIQTYLDEMGVEYDLYNGISGSEYLNQLLLDTAKMAEYDIIFLNCGISDGWFSQKGTVGNNIKEYVEGGGSIYSSDWAHYFFEAAFTDALDFHGNDDNVNDARIGKSTHVPATVLDANMIAIIGSSSADLNYNLGSWVIADTAKSTVDVLIRGNAPIDPWYGGGTVSNAPLAVRFEKGGTALYTTFHNEAQATIDMEALLEEIILSL